jgi:hypothetical protein
MWVLPQGFRVVEPLAVRVVGPLAVRVVELVETTVAYCATLCTI